MEIVIIAAIAENGVIGREGKLPWHLPEDLKRFKRLTEGYPVIMGRKTYQSLPENYRPLPNRLNIVLTRNRDFAVEGKNVSVAHSLQEALASLDNRDVEDTNIDCGRVYVIGGQSVYRKALPYADKMELTLVHEQIEGDALFPRIDWSGWREESKDDKKGFSFVTYRALK